MDRLDRVFKLHQIFSERRTPISTEDLLDRLEDCSLPTLSRDISWMRTYLNAPIENSKGEGYYYSRSQASFQLPGLWLNAKEIQSLLTLHNLVSEIQPGVLDELLAPVKQRVEKLLNTTQLMGEQNIADKVKIIPQRSRKVPSDTYHQIVTAMTMGKQVSLIYRARLGAKEESRILSPQQLIYYRDNWYLDAWCHNREDLRSFSIDRMFDIKMLERQAIAVDDDKLKGFYASAYGIFGGPATEIAILKFSPHAAQWVAEENWHPEQSHRWLEDGYYELSIPYRESPELIGEVLRWAPEVEVISPLSLRQKIHSIVTRTAQNHQ